MILGHITSTFVLGDLLKRIKIRVHVPLLILGAISPDLFDKSIAYFFSYPGRGVAHSLLAQSLLAFFCLRVAGKYKTFILTFYAGTLLHLLQDWPSLTTLFWPLLGVWDTGSSRSP